MSAINSQTVDLVKRLDYALSFGTTRRETLTNLLRECKELLSVLSGPADDARDAARYRAIKNMSWSVLENIKHRQQVFLAYGGTTFDKAVDEAIAERSSATDRSERG